MIQLKKQGEETVVQLKEQHQIQLEEIKAQLKEYQKQLEEKVYNGAIERTASEAC